MSEPLDVGVRAINGLLTLVGIRDPHKRLMRIRISCLAASVNG